MTPTPPVNRTRTLIIISVIVILASIGAAALLINNIRSGNSTVSTSSSSSSSSTTSMLSSMSSSLTSINSSTPTLSSSSVVNSGKPSSSVSPTVAMTTTNLTGCKTSVQTAQDATLVITLSEKNTNYNATNANSDNQRLRISCEPKSRWTATAKTQGKNEVEIAAEVQAINLKVVDKSQILNLDSVSRTKIKNPYRSTIALGSQAGPQSWSQVLFEYQDQVYTIGLIDPSYDNNADKLTISLQ